MSSTNETKPAETSDSSGRIAKYFGMAAPYNFSIALPALFAFFMFFLVVIFAIALVATDKLFPGTPRGTFFTYLAVMGILAIIFARRPRLSWFLSTVMFLELALAFVPHYANQVGISLPGNLLPASKNSRFEYHHLLQGVPIPNHVGKSPDGGVISHTSFGTRGPEPTEEDFASKKLISAYGGSSTYDVFVSDEQTWPNQLSLLLENQAVIVNRGVPGYNTVENLTQTVFYDQVKGLTPSCAVYYEGWNDAQGAYLPNLDPGYADWHLPGQVGALEVGKEGRFSPLMTILRGMTAFGPPPSSVLSSNASTTPGDGADPRLEEIFRRNIESIISINNSRGTKSVFIGQVLNSAALTSDTSNGWIPLVRNKDLIDMVARLNSVMKAEAIRLGAVYVDAQQSQFVPSDFVDEGHFAPAGSAKLAKNIAPAINQSCLGAN
jgi:lysophospholipase L1-like esterase